jgi:hypothetical protein
VVDSDQSDVDVIVLEVEKLCQQMAGVQPITESMLDLVEHLLARIDVVHERLLTRGDQRSQEQMATLLVGVERLLRVVEDQASGLAQDLKNITKKRQGLGKYFASLRGK